MSNQLVYMALGGAGEIGMNLYLYGIDVGKTRKWLIVDAGVTFPKADSSPGVDLIMADPSFLVENKDDILGLVITHAHEDHVGAVGMLLDLIGNVPIYARKFTAEITKGKLARFAIENAELKTVAPYPHEVELGPFTVSFVPISHSIPEASGVLIKTSAGNVFHTGDFKCDETPQIGEAFSDDLFREIGAIGIDALVCDSTNVFSPKEGRSEAGLKDAIAGYLGDCKGLVVATTFASNLARVRSLAQAGYAVGRKVIVVGRAMNTMISAGQKTGVLHDMPPLTDIEDFYSLKRSDVLIIATGSQGEYRAATAQLSRGNYRGIQMTDGDRFLFSSKTIPGNEISVAQVLNDLAKLGVDVVHDDDRFHVSGHANAPDLTRMHKLIHPNAVVPMHGEYRHLRAHKFLAEDNGYSSVIAPNGAMVALSGGRLEIVERIETGRYYLDGKVMISALDGIVRERIHMANRGHVAVAIALDDESGQAEDAWVILSGLPEKDISNQDVAALMEAAIDDRLAGMKRKDLFNDEKIEDAVTKIVRKFGVDEFDKKPVVKVFIQRIVSE